MHVYLECLRFCYDSMLCHFHANVDAENKDALKTTPCLQPFFRTCMREKELHSSFFPRLSTSMLHITVLTFLALQSRDREENRQYWRHLSERAKPWQNSSLSSAVYKSRSSTYQPRSTVYNAAIARNLSQQHSRPVTHPRNIMVTRRPNPATHLHHPRRGRKQTAMSSGFQARRAGVSSPVTTAVAMFSYTARASPEASHSKGPCYTREMPSLSPSGRRGADQRPIASQRSSFPASLHSNRWQQRRQSRPSGRLTRYTPARRVTMTTGGRRHRQRLLNVTTRHRYERIATPRLPSPSRRGQR